jgi:DNA-binding CsgD family transcriptional regulator
MQTAASRNLRTPDLRSALRPDAPSQPRSGLQTPGLHGIGLPSCGAAALLEAAMDHLGFGVMVVDPDLRVVYANAVVRRECARGAGLSFEGGRLSLSMPMQLDEFRRALGAARHGRWSLVHHGRGDERMSLAVLPLADDARDPDAPALVVFGMRGRCRDLALEFYARSCGLTLAETRVLRALADGMTVREIAQRYDVRITTVRTQVSSIRHRTNTRSVVDLVRKLGTLPPITPAIAVDD